LLMIAHVQPLRFLQAATDRSINLVRKILLIYGELSTFVPSTDMEA
jgi:hypothetical protein